MRLIVACLFMAAAALSAADRERDARLPPDQRVVEDLPQDQRWAVLDAQEQAAKQRWTAAAVAYEKFSRRFPDSPLWAWACWQRADALRRDRKHDGAIAALKELVDLAPEAPEIPETLLLLARCQAEAGLVRDAVATARDLLLRFAASPAATPARILLDDGLQNLAKQESQKPDELARARLVALAAFSEALDADPRNREAVAQGIERLGRLALAQGDLARVGALVAKVQEGPLARDLGEAAWRIGRDGILQAWTANADGAANGIAETLWKDPLTRLLERGRLRQGWLGDAGRSPAAAAKARGVAEKDFQAGIPGELRELATAADEGAKRCERGDGRRDGLAWLGFSARVAAGDLPAALRGLGPALGRALVRRDLNQLLDATRGGDPLALLPVLEQIADPRERRLAEMDLRGGVARNTRDVAVAKREGALAIIIAEAFEKEDPDRAGDYIRLQAEVRRAMKEYKAAIEDYTRLNQPPETDFAIADCLVEAGEPKAAFAKLGEIAAIHRTQAAGPRALLRQGVMAHRELKDKAQAVMLLRQLCDEYPDTREYGEAHRYLQSELDVTYTGGGGKRQPK